MEMKVKQMSEPVWLTLARMDIGTMEAPGKAVNPKVMAYYKDAGHDGKIEDDSTTPWCSAFVGAILKRSQIKPSGSLLARSYESWGVPLKLPALGCIAVKRRQGGEAWQGHVGFCVAANPSYVWLLGGNQSDSVSIAAFPRWQFTAWRWPSAVPFTTASLPDSAKGATGVKEA